MLAKCANPSCSTPLIYLREGKIFMMEHPAAAAEVGPPGPVLVKSSNRVEHFWLCGPCSAEMTITYDNQYGIAVVPKRRTLGAVAS